MVSLTLKEQAYLEIRDLILSGELKPGTFLTERELTERLGMSRTPVRSALEKLEAEGIIISTPNKGPMVAEISMSKAYDIYDLRIAIETHVIKRISNFQIDEEEFGALEENLQKQETSLEKKDPVQFAELDIDFHKKLVGLYRNEEIIKTFERIQNQYTMLAFRMFEYKAEDLTRFYKDHANIIELLIKNKIEECTDLIINHLETSQSFYFNPSMKY